MHQEKNQPTVYTGPLTISQGFQALRDCLRIITQDNKVVSVSLPLNIVGSDGPCSQGSFPS